MVPETRYLRISDTIPDVRQDVGLDVRAGPRDLRDIIDFVNFVELADPPDPADLRDTVDQSISIGYPRNIVDPRIPQTHQRPQETTWI